MDPEVLLVDYVVKQLAEYPSDVTIEKTIDEKGVFLQLSVNRADLGRIIGRQGTVAQSLRTILRALGAKHDARYNLKIVERESES